MELTKVVFGDNWCDEPGPSTMCVEPGFSRGPQHEGEKALSKRILSIEEGLKLFKKPLLLATYQVVHKND